MTVYTFPAALIPTTSALSLVSKTRKFTSRFNSAMQTAGRPGTALRLTMAFKSLDDSNHFRRELQGFIALMDGQTNRFQVHDHSYTRGGTGTGGLVKGVDQTGNLLLTDGWPNSTVIFKRGDQVTIPNTKKELKIITAQVTTDGSGNATLPINPGIHVSPADNLALDVTDPEGEWMLIESENGWTNVPGVFSDFILDAIEDIAA